MESSGSLMGAQSESLDKHSRVCFVQRGGSEEGSKVDIRV